MATDIDCLSVSDSFAEGEVYLVQEEGLLVTSRREFQLKGHDSSQNIINLRPNHK
jgi:hypothetical protein